jgi:CubicO group peptidase (beta-lactamase class C family)
MDQATKSLPRRLEEELQLRLDEVCNRRGIKQAWVGAIHSGIAYRASVDRESRSHAPFEVQIGCLAKALTATLIWQLILDGRLHLQDAAAKHLEAGDAAADVLAGITIAQLLDHTHGLDSSSLRELPVTGAGWIDLPALLGRLHTAGRLCDAGQLYNYCSAGAFVSAAILERVHRRPYRELLDQLLLRPLGITLREQAAATPPPGEAPASSVCPATGGDMIVSLDDLMTFLRFHLGANAAGRAEPPFMQMFEPSAPLPGWSPLEKGATRGWKDFGGGWAGQNASFPASAFLTRINVTRGIAFVVAARAANADATFPIMEHLFGDVIPELARLSMPKLLRQQDWARVDQSRYIGCYRNAAQGIRIEATPAALQLAVNGAGAESSASPVTRRLRAADQDIFFTEPMDRGDFPFIQFLRHPPSGPAGFVWNGRSLWRLAPG